MSKRSKRRKKQRRQQSKKRQRTSNSPKINDRLETAEALMEDGEFAQALELLQEQLATDPTDKTRRLLIKCHVNLEQYQEAVTGIAELHEADHFDYLMAGWCFVQLENWDAAIANFNNSLEQNENADVLYWLAVAHSRGRNNYSLDDEEKVWVDKYLQRAISLPNCRIEAFFWLEDNHGWDKDEVARRIEILRQALEVHPHSTQVRYRLAQRLIIRCESPQEGLDVLAPVLESESVDPYDLLLAFKAYTSLGEYLAALHSLNAIEFSDELGTIGLNKIKGDTLQQLEKLDEAETLYHQEFQATQHRIRNLRKMNEDKEQEDGGQFTIRNALR